MCDLTHKIVSDPMLTPDAVRLVLYVYGLGPGEHEIDAETLRLLLRCKSDTPLYKARKCAREYIQVRDGGQGHCQRYKYVGPTEDLSDRSLPQKTYSEDRSSPEPTYSEYVFPTEDLSCASSPSTSSPPSPDAGARVDDIHLGKLRRMLEPHGDVVDRFATSAKHNPNWARDLWSSYRAPSGEAGDGGGTEWAAVFAGEDEELAVRVLVNAMRDYAGNGERFAGFLFRRYVRTALNEVRSADKAAAEGTGTYNPAPPRRGGREKQPLDAQVYTPKRWSGEFNG